MASQLASGDLVSDRYASALYDLATEKNLIDSVFYGYLFTESFLNIATFNPGSGYESIFYGHVVDMLQFPMFNWTWPSWIPFLGGNDFTFFEPVFNIADTAISTGVGIMIVFNKKVFPQNS